MDRCALAFIRYEEIRLNTTGKLNGITDVEGLLVGHYHQREAACGVTVIICPQGAVTGVDVRGSAPGTRETDLLDPVNLVEKTQAVVLSGGSVYGLAASDGVVRWLAEKGMGFPLEATGETEKSKTHVAPIVPAATLYDLGRGVQFVPPIDTAWGRKACQAANSQAVPMGCVGAGTGARSGAIKGGVGSASVVLGSGITVAAIVAVNSLGSVVDPDTGALWEGRLEIDGEFGDLGQRRVKLPASPETTSSGKNTTIGVVATDAALTKVQAKKIAQMAHDGMARAIRPAHTMFDGDTIFCMATGQQDLPEQSGFFTGAAAQAVSELGHAAADCMTRAIIHGILAAESMGSLTAFRDLESL
jgi:L-aminopeptidase/D-esterase-like protein